MSCLFLGKRILLYMINRMIWMEDLILDSFLSIHSDSQRGVRSNPDLNEDNRQSKSGKEAWRMEVKKICVSWVGTIPKSRIPSGLRNISFGLPSRSIFNRAFLTLALEAYLDLAIVDPMEMIFIYSLVLFNDNSLAEKEGRWIASGLREDSHHRIRYSLKVGKEHISPLHISISPKGPMISLP